MNGTISVICCMFIPLYSLWIFFISIITIAHDYKIALTSFYSVGHEFIKYFMKSAIFITAYISGHKWVITIQSYPHWVKSKTNTKWFTLVFMLKSCRDILSLVFHLFRTIPNTADPAFTDRIQACVKVCSCIK